MLKAIFRFGLILLVLCYCIESFAAGKTVLSSQLLEMQLHRDLIYSEEEVWDDSSIVAYYSQMEQTNPYLRKAPPPSVGINVTQFILSNLVGLAAFNAINIWYFKYFEDCYCDDCGGCPGGFLNTEGGLFLMELVAIEAFVLANSSAIYSIGKTDEINGHYGRIVQTENLVALGMLILVGMNINSIDEKPYLFGIATPSLITLAGILSYNRNRFYIEPNPQGIESGIEYKLTPNYTAHLGFSYQWSAKHDKSPSWD